MEKASAASSRHIAAANPNSLEYFIGDGADNCLEVNVGILIIIGYRLMMRCHSFAERAERINRQSYLKKNGGCFRTRHIKKRGFSSLRYIYAKRLKITS